MRHRKTAVGVSALVLLSFALTLGCSGPNYSLKQEKLVIVTLRDGKPYPSVDPVVLSYSKGELAHWVYCGEGELTITMKESPFTRPLEQAGNHVRSWKPREDAIKIKKFPYTITLKTKDGAFTKDPDVEVWP
jgi:hypothetical protein